MHLCHHSDITTMLVHMTTHVDIASVAKESCGYGNKRSLKYISIAII